MRIEFKISVEDQLKFQKDNILNQRSEKVRQQVKQFARFYFLIILVTVGVFMLFLRNLVLNFIILGAVILVFSILVFGKKLSTLAWYGSKRKITRNIMNAYYSKDYTQLRDTVILELEEEGFEGKIGETDISYRWKDMTRVIFLEGLICIYTTDLFSILIPTNTLKESLRLSVEKFIEERVKEYHLESNL